MWVTDTGNSYAVIASDKSQFILLDWLKSFIPLIQVLLRQYGPVKTSSGPKFDYS